MDFVLLQLIVLAAIVGCAMTLMALLTLWAAKSSMHWFGRAVVLLACWSAFVPIPAYELVLVFVAESLTILAALGLRRMAAVRRRQAVGAPDSDARTAQITLGNLLLAMLLAPAVAAGLAQLVLHSVAGWTAWAIAGIVWGLVALVALNLVLGRTQLALRLSLLPTIGLMGMALDASKIGIPVQPRYLTTVAAYLISPLIAAMLVLWLALAVASRWIRAGQPRRVPGGYGKWLARPALLLLTVPIVLISGIAYSHLFRYDDFPTVELPEPNGAAMCSRVASKLNWQAIPGQDADEAAPAQLIAFAAGNRVALGELREMLDLDWQFPLAWNESDIQAASFSDAINLCRALQAGALAAVAEGRIDAVLEDQLGILRLGYNEPRGGLVIHYLVGVAIQSVGEFELFRQLDLFSPEQCRRTVHEIQRLEAGDEPLAAIRQRDQLWERVAMGWQGRLWKLVESIGEPNDPISLSIRNADLRRRTFVNLLLCELALRQYRLERGRAAASLAELVPAYLPAVPADPFDDRPLRIAHHDDGTATVYSVGPNGVDDGGRYSPLDVDPRSWDDLSFAETMRESNPPAANNAANNTAAGALESNEPPPLE